MKDLEEENLIDYFALSFFVLRIFQLGSASNYSKDTKSEFYHNLSMQVLSKSSHEILLNLPKTPDLVMNINHILQNKSYKN